MRERAIHATNRLALLVALATLTIGGPAQAKGRDHDDEDDHGDRDRHEERGGACSRHAQLLHTACLADVKDDLLVARADCAYVASADEERACRREARVMRNEATEECRDVREARLELCDLLGEARYDVDFDPAWFVDPDDIGGSVAANPYWPLNAGHTHVIVGEKELTVAAVTAEVRIVGGLPCRVLRDLVFEVGEDDEGGVEYEAIEVTQDWYGQTIDGDIVYCGENTYEIEDGLIDNTDGSFANGTDGARAGYLLRANPLVGSGDRQEMASDEAEDYVRYESLAASPSEEEGGDPAAFPCNGGCLQTYEVNPRDPGGAEYKYYLAGVGFVLATKLEVDDGDLVPTGEREEVACSGDDLDDVLESCAVIADLDALREALCVWAPDAFCEDEDALGF